MMTTDLTALIKTMKERKKALDTIVWSCLKLGFSAGLAVGILTLFALMSLCGFLP